MPESLRKKEEKNFKIMLQIITSNLIEELYLSRLALEHCSSTFAYLSLSHHDSFTQEHKRVMNFDVDNFSGFEGVEEGGYSQNYWKFTHHFWWPHESWWIIV